MSGVGEVFVPGRCVPQGSMQPFVDKAGNARMRSDNAGLDGWRATVKTYVRQQVGPGIRFPDGPVKLGLVFVLPRRSQETATIGPHTVKPDIDKLARAILDALTGTLYTDDAQVVGFGCGKRRAERGEPPGVHICWWPGMSRLSDPSPTEEGPAHGETSDDAAHG